MKSRLLAALSLCLALSLLAAAQSPVRASAFAFVSWGDTKDGLDVLATESRQLRGRSDSIARAPHAAFKDRVHVQARADLLDVAAGG